MPSSSTLLVNRCLLISALLITTLPAVADQRGQDTLFERYLDLQPLIKGGALSPRWMADGNSFWYVEGSDAEQRIMLVDPVKGTLEQLAQLPEDRAELPVRTHPRQVRSRFPSILPALYEVPSPDRDRFINLKDHNLWLRSAADDQLRQLTGDGVEGFAWDTNAWIGRPWSHWSPDGTLIAATKYDLSGVHMVPVVDWLQREEVVSYYPYPLVGDVMPRAEIQLVNATTGKTVQVHSGQGDYYLDIVGFRQDGSELLFTRLSRDSKKLDFMAADIASGETRTIMSESAGTFLNWTPYYMVAGAPIILLDDGKRFIFKSQSSGWNNFYLYDLDHGLLHALTSGQSVVGNVMRVDLARDTVFYTAQSDPKRVYDVHLNRVSLQGGRSQQLTAAPGQHRISFSPSGKFFLDTHSSLDRPPTVELRDADGKLLKILAEANIDALLELGWIAPEPFVTLAADDKTELHGVLYKPHDFDPGRRYPVVEYIYAGGQLSVVQRSFNGQGWGHLLHIGFPRALAQLGFIVLVVDGRGTPGRGKAFQDIVYRSIGRNEISDHATALQQVAASRPYMDMGRVGIFGISFGGYFTVRAMLTAPDVYHVGVASGIAEIGPDIRASGLEAFMDLISRNPQGYEQARNAPLAGRLQGKLLLAIGTSDINATFSQTLWLADAFARADKHIDMVILPNANHAFMYPDSTMPSRYWLDSIRNYLVEHLQPEP